MHKYNQATDIKIDKHSLEPEDAEQTYSVQPGEKRSLECWKDMLSKGQITEEELPKKITKRLKTVK